MTTPTVDPGLARDIDAMERGLLLDPDPQALTIYADMLEEGGLGEEQWRDDMGEDAASPARRVVRILSGRYASYRLDTIAASVRQNGLARMARPVRLAWAALLDAAHPVEGAELRLSVASGEWPCGGAKGDGYVARWLADAPGGGGKTAAWCVWKRRDDIDWLWSPSKQWVCPLATGMPETDRDAAVRTATRHWLEEILDGR